MLLRVVLRIEPSSSADEVSRRRFQEAIGSSGFERLHSFAVVQSFGSRLRVCPIDSPLADVGHPFLNSFVRHE